MVVSKVSKLLLLIEAQAALQDLGDDPFGLREPALGPIDLAHDVHRPEKRTSLSSPTLRRASSSPVTASGSACDGLPSAQVEIGELCMVRRLAGAPRPGSGGRFQGPEITARPRSGLFRAAHVRASRNMASSVSVWPSPRAPAGSPPPVAGAISTSDRVPSPLMENWRRFTLASPSMALAVSPASGALLPAGRSPAPWRTGPGYCPRRRGPGRCRRSSSRAASIGGRVRNRSPTRSAARSTTWRSVSRSTAQTVVVHGWARTSR